MKKSLFMVLSIMVSLISIIFLFFAAVLEPQDGSKLVHVCLLSYLGVIVPHIVLEIAKFFCFKRDYKKIYAFDIISVLMCLVVIVTLNLVIAGKNYWVILKNEFFLYNFPWIILLLSYVLLLKVKSRRYRMPPLKK